MMNNIVKPLRKNRLTYAIVIILLPIMLCSLMPIWLLVISSFADKQALANHGFQIWPSAFSLDAYLTLFIKPDFLFRSYGITAGITAIGMSIGVLIMSMFAYAVSRSHLKGRGALSFFIFFTLLFQGGTLPYYLMITKFLRLQNNLLVLILPLLVAPFQVLLLRTYFLSLPTSLIESAKLDGAKELRIFFTIVFPLSLPAIMTVALFQLVTYWNDMYQALLFIDKQDLYPLQYLLYKISYNTSIIPTDGSQYTGTPRSPLALRMAMATLALIPIILAFAFIQRYFVKGITLGAIKGE